MGSGHFITFTVFSLLIFVSISQCYAQENKDEKYSNHYRNAVHLDLIPGFLGIGYERIAGKLRKPRLALSAGVGYSQAPQPFFSGRPFYRQIPLYTNVLSLIPVSPNSDIEIGLNGVFSPNIYSEKGLPKPASWADNHQIISGRVGYRWHTNNRKWLFRVGMTARLAHNIHPAKSHQPHSFRFNFSNPLPCFGIGRTF